MPHSSLSEPAQRPARSSSSGVDRPGARDAADRRIARVVQRVVRDLVDVDVRPDALRVPVRERVDLPDAVALRPLDLRRRRAARRLVAADAGDPGVVRLERLQRAARPCGCGSSGRGRAPRGSAPRLVLLGDGDHLGADQLEPVALDEPVARLVASRGRRAACRARPRRCRARARRPCARARTTASARSRSGRAGRRTRAYAQRRSVLRRASPRRQGAQAVLARSPRSTSLSVSAAQAEAQRLERDHLVGRDVAEVHLGAELLHEPGLRAPSSAPRRSGRRRSISWAISSISPVRISPVGAEDPGGAALAGLGDHLPGAGLELLPDPRRPTGTGAKIDLRVLRADLGEDGEVAREVGDQLQLALARDLDRAVGDLDVREAELGRASACTRRACPARRRPRRSVPPITTGFSRSTSSLRAQVRRHVRRAPAELDDVDVVAARLEHVLPRRAGRGPCRSRA